MATHDIKRYILIAHIEPRGGANDIVGQFATIGAAKDEARTKYPNARFSCHIYDVVDEKAVGNRVMCCEEWMGGRLR